MQEPLSRLLGTKSARKILRRYQTLQELVKVDYRQIVAECDVSVYRAKQIEALLHLITSYNQEVSRSSEGLKMIDPDIVFRYMNPFMVSLVVECFYILTLNSANYLLNRHTISTGILTSSLVHPREVFRQAILDNAASVILLHNHPSGQVLPSEEDKIITRRLVECGQLMNVPVLDHLILGGGNYFSFRETGLID